MSMFSSDHLKSLLGILILSVILIGIYTRWEKINQTTERSTYSRPTTHTIDRANQSTNTQTASHNIKGTTQYTSSSNHCPAPELPGRWRKVSNLCYVFGAYMDTRPVVKAVRIIGIHGTKAKGPDKCHLFFPDDNKPEIIDLQSAMNPENHGMAFSAYIYTCNIPSHRKDYPCAVKLLFKNLTEMGSLPIYRPSSTTKRNYTVCVPTLYNYNHSQQLVDTIEANRYFGANHYVIYNTSATGEVNKYLEYYIKNNIVTVVPWNIPKSLSKGIHYHGQLVSIQDCFYRSRAISKYVVFMDIDEVIVPRNASTWDEMLRAASKSKVKPRQGGYNIRSKIFRYCQNKGEREMDMDLQEEAKQLGMKSVLARTAISTLFPYKTRSKMIIGSDAGTNVGIHFMYGYMPSYGNILVNPSIGMIHHYRNKGACKEKIKPDNYMNRFSKQLIARVKNIHEQVKHGS